MNKPLDRDHYTYVNQLLDLTADKQLAAKKIIANKEAVVTALQAEQKRLEESLNDQLEKQTAQDNLLKISRVLEILANDEKRKNYDDALTLKPTISVQSKDEKQVTTCVALVSVKEIENEFNDFAKELLAKKNEQGQALYAEGDFKCEHLPGPPQSMILTFPTAEAAREFIGKMYNKNMMMQPNGSQNAESIKPPPEQRKYKSELSSLKSSAIEPDANLEQQNDADQTQRFK